MTAARLYLTRAEIFTAAWRRFRSVHGAKTRPRQHPHYWAACLRMMWQAAKGDAFVLCAIRGVAREAARKAPCSFRSPRSSRPARSWCELSQARSVAA
jgi:hypothetical protein